MVTFENDAPMRCTCKHRASRDFFVCKGYDIHENGQFHKILKESILYEEPIHLEIDEIADSIEIKSLPANRNPEPNVNDNTSGEYSTVMRASSGTPDALNRNCDSANETGCIPETIEEDNENDTLNDDDSLVYHRSERGTIDARRETSCESCQPGWDSSRNNVTELKSFESSNLENQNEAQGSSLVNPGDINRENNQIEVDHILRSKSVKKQIVHNGSRKGIRPHVHFPDEEDSMCNLLRRKSDFSQNELTAVWAVRKY